MGIDAKLLKMHALIRDHGISDEISAVLFRTFSADGVLGPLQVVFRRIDDDREASMPYHTATKLLRLKSQWSTDGLWQEFAIRSRMAGREAEMHFREPRAFELGGRYRDDLTQDATELSKRTG